MRRSVVALCLLLGAANAGRITVRLENKPDDICWGVHPGTMIVSRDGQEIWRATTQGLGGVTKAVTSPNGHYVLTLAHGCGYIQIWDVKNKNRTFSLLANQNQYRVLNATFTPDGDRLIVNFPGNIKKPEFHTDFNYFKWPISSMWDISRRKRVGKIGNIYRESSFYNTATTVFSADGKKMIFTDSYGPASVFDAFTGAWIQTFSRYEGRGAASASFSTDGKQVTVTYVSGVVVTYDVQSAKLLKVLKPS